MLELSVLGPGAVRQEGVALATSPGRLTLLARLALDGPASRAELAALLWPGAEPGAARRNLRQELHRLRASPLSPHLVLDGETVALRDARTDLTCLRAAAQADDLPGALALDAGPLLTGLEVAENPALEGWLPPHREAVAHLVRTLRAKLAARLEAQGDLRGALEQVTAALEREPLAEDLTREAMRLHALLGEGDAALARYAAFRGQLERELGLAPTPETLALLERLRGELPVTDPAPPRGSLHHPPLVGRLGLLSQLRERLQAGPGLTVLEGEPGVGKSAVALELVRQWGPHLLLNGREEGAGVPFMALLEALRPRLAVLRSLQPAVRHEVARLLPELASDAPPEPPTAEGSARFLSGLASALGAVLGGGLLVLDDLHWLDPSSLEVTQLLWRHAPPRAVGTLRTLEASRHPTLGSFLGLLERRGELVRLPVTALSDTDTLRLVRALSPSGRGGVRFARRLHEATGGNPLFVLETLRGLLERGELREEGGDWHTPYDEATQDYRELSLPTSVRAALLARLDHLDAGIRRLLEGAALLGERFAWPEVQEATPLSGWAALEALEGALEAGLLVPDGQQRYRFAHELVRRALADHLRPERRRFLHERLSAALDDLGVAPARLAPHLEGSGQRARAAQVRLEAADQARAVYAHAEALEHYAQALGNGLDAGAAFETHLARAEVYRSLDDKVHWEEALDAARALLPAGQHSPRLELSRAELDFYSGRYAEASQRGAALWDRDDLDPEQRGWAALWAGNAHSRTARLPEALTWYERGVGVAPQTALDLRGRLHNAWGSAAKQAGDAQRGREQVALAIETLRRGGSRKSLGMAYNTAGVIELHDAHYEAARPHFQAAQALFAELGEVYMQGLALANLSAVDIELGRDDEAVWAINRGLELQGEGADPYTTGLFHERLFHLFTRRGRPEQAAQHLDLSIEIADAHGLLDQGIQRRLDKLALLASSADRQALVDEIERDLATLPVARQAIFRQALAALDEGVTPP